MNNQTIMVRWSIYLSLLLPIFLSACGGGSGGGNVTTDTTAPLVSSTSPEDGATGVTRDTTLTATFNENIFATTVDAASFTLVDSALNNISGTVSFDGLDNMVSLSPDATLARLSTYTATLTTDITDLSGNALAANTSWSFTTVDGSWSGAELIETDDVGSAFYPEIAFDSSGNALVGWSQSDGTRNNIWVNRFNGTSWGGAKLIETDDAGDAWGPEIAFDNSGNALAVWHQHDGTRDNIWANRFE